MEVELLSHLNRVLDGLSGQPQAPVAYSVNMKLDGSDGLDVSEKRKRSPQFKSIYFYKIIVAF